MPRSKQKQPLPESFKVELGNHLNELFKELCKMHQGNAVIENLVINKTPLTELKEKHEMNEKLLSLTEKLNQLLERPQEYEPLARILDDPTNPKPIKEVIEKYNITEIKDRIKNISGFIAEIFLLKHERDFLKERIRPPEYSTLEKSPEPPKKRKRSKTENSDMDTIIQLAKRISDIEAESEENQTVLRELRNQVESLNHSNAAKDEEIKLLQQDNMKKRKRDDSLEEKNEEIKRLRRVIENLTTENRELSQKNHQLHSDNKRLNEDNEFYKGARRHFKLKSASYRDENQDLLSQVSALDIEYQEKNNIISDQLTQTEIELKKSHEEIESLRKQLTSVTDSRQQLIEKVNNHGKKHLQKAVEAKNANPPQHVRATNQTRKALTHFFYRSSKTELFLAENLTRTRINKRRNNQEAKEIVDKILNNNKVDQQTKQKANALKQEIIQKYPSLA